MQTLSASYLPLNIKVALASFVEIQASIYETLGSEEKLIIDNWRNEIIRIKPLYLLRPDFLKKINKDIFSQQIVSDYVMLLSFEFFFYESKNSEMIVDHLSLALSMGQESEGLCTIPTAVSDSFASQILKQSVISRWFFKPTISTKQFLKANKHLILIYLIQLTNRTTP